MKYIEPPTKRNSKYVPKRKSHKGDLVIRVILAVGTLIVILILSQYIK